MSDVTNPEDRYRSADYFSKNPTWDVEDSPWKADQVVKILEANGATPLDVAEVGCGAGGVLASLRSRYPNAAMTGYDIAPDASRFWSQYADKAIEFHVGNFLELNQTRHDLVMVLDVIEHLPDPFTFLARLRQHGKMFVFHIPLDLSLLSVLRETPLLYVRKKVGHIHYFTKGLALALISECGYQIMDWFYTGAAVCGPRPSWRTRVANIPRRLAYAVHKDLGVRLLGGETLMVLARVSD